MGQAHAEWGRVIRPALAALLFGALAGRAPGRADALADVTRPVRGWARRASSGLFDPESNRDAHHVRPGQRFVLADLEGPGEVRHLWFTVASRDRRYPRTLVLRVFYDGSDVPSVETPIGDFFAAGNGMRANVSSIPIEVSSYGRALNSYWRMPFHRRCVIEVHNQGPETMTVYFQCDWLKVRRLPADALYFHARYRQEYPPRPFSSYTIFEGQGEGQYVGTVLSFENLVGSWFGEADDRFYVDGDQTPSIVGTGTEDYFNDAWNLRLTSHLRVGTTICETKGEERRVTCYRWHIDDPVPFRKSLRVEIERRSFIDVADPDTGKTQSYDFRYRPDYLSSVAYWYQKGVGRAQWPLAPVEERLLPEVWVEPAWILERVRTSPGLQPRRAPNRTCHLKVFFTVRNDRVGSWVEFPVALEQAGRYAVSVFQNLFRHYGIWRVVVRGDGVEEVLHPGLDFYDDLQGRTENSPESFHHGTTVETKLGVRRLEAGQYWIRFECVGANPLSEHPGTGSLGQGYSLGLDAISFRRLPLTDPYGWMQEYLEQEAVLFAERERVARETVNALAQAVESVRRDGGEYPRALVDLVGTPHWEGQGIPLDPWGQPYQYRPRGDIQPWACDLWSHHGDSRHPDDWIGNWHAPFRLGNEAPADSLVFEGEDLRVGPSSGEVAAAKQELSSYGNAPISRNGLLFIRCTKPGDWSEIVLPAEVPAGRYVVYVFAVTSWDYGICQWSLGGVPIGEPFDAHSRTVGMRALPPATVMLREPARALRVEVVGRADRSSGYYAGLDAIVLRPIH